jgi:hypothetical protein
MVETGRLSSYGSTALNLHSPPPRLVESESAAPAPNIPIILVVMSSFPRRVGLHSLPGVSDWLRGPHRLSSIGVLTSGLHVGYVDHTGCHQLVKSANPTGTSSPPASAPLAPPKTRRGSRREPRGRVGTPGGGVRLVTWTIPVD